MLGYAVVLLGNASEDRLFATSSPFASSFRRPSVVDKAQ